MRRWRSLLASATAVVIAVAAVAACAVDEDGDPRSVPDEEVPFGLLETTVAPPMSPTTENARQTVTLHLVSGEGLVAVERAVADDDPAKVLAMLQDGVSEDELGDGLRTALATDGDVGLISLTDASGSVAVVDLADPFADLDAKSQLLGIAQIVLTLTRIGEIREVAFTRAGAPTEVLRADGTVTADAVGRSDYVPLLLPPE